MEELAEAVYNSMMGFLIPSAQVPGVENLFEPGSEADRRYEEIYRACERICDRLGSPEDSDCEIIKNSLLELQRIIGMELFKKGYEFGQNGK